MDENIHIRGDAPVFIKKTTRNMLPLMQKQIQQRVDRLNAKHAARKNPPKHKTAAEYFAEKTQNKVLAADGSIVVGNLTGEQKGALTSNSDALVRKQLALRNRARDIMNNPHLQDKSVGNYYRGLRDQYTSYQALARQQGRLPNSPHKDRDSFLEG